MRTVKTERRARWIARENQGMYSPSQRTPQATSRRPNLKRWPRSHQGGHLSQVPGAVIEGLPLIWLAFYHPAKVSSLLGRLGALPMYLINGMLP